MKEVMKFLKMLKWHPEGEFIMNTFKLKEIADVNSGVTVRRYIDEGSNLKKSLFKSQFRRAENYLICKKWRCLQSLMKDTSLLRGIY